MPAGRRAVLGRLKAAGEATADQLAADLGITVGAVRQQLGPLGDAGLVAHRDERHGPGPAPPLVLPHPRGRGAVSRSGTASSPTSCSGSSRTPTRRWSPSAFEQRAEQRRERAAPRLAGRLPRGAGRSSWPGSSTRTATWPTARPTADGSWLVTERNCAILDVARHHREACASELAFLRAVLPDATVERVSHMLSGGHHCAYRIAPSSPPAPSGTPRRPPTAATGPPRVRSTPVRPAPTPGGHAATPARPAVRQAQVRAGAPAGSASLAADVTRSSATPAARVVPRRKLSPASPLLDALEAWIVNLGAAKPSPATLAAYRRDVEGIGARLAVAGGPRRARRRRLGRPGATGAAGRLRLLGRPTTRPRRCGEPTRPGPASSTSWSPRGSATATRWRPSRNPRRRPSCPAPSGPATPSAACSGSPPSRTPGPGSRGRPGIWPLVATFCVTGIREAEAVGLDVGSLSGEPGARRLEVRGKGGKARPIPIDAAPRSGAVGVPAPAGRPLSQPRSRPPVDAPVRRRPRPPAERGPGAVSG